ASGISNQAPRRARGLDADPLCGRRLIFWPAGDDAPLAGAGRGLPCSSNPAHRLRMDPDEKGGRPLSPAGQLNGADLAWMMTSTALVLLMTPALGFFYGGMVGTKNVLNTILMSFTTRSEEHTSELQSREN